MLWQQLSQCNHIHSGCLFIVKSKTLYIIKVAIEHIHYYIIRWKQVCISLTELHAGSQGIAAHLSVCTAQADGCVQLSVSGPSGPGPCEIIRFFTGSRPTVVLHALELSSLSLMHHSYVPLHFSCLCTHALDVTAAKGSQRPQVTQGSEV